MSEREAFRAELYRVLRGMTRLELQKYVADNEITCYATTTAGIINTALHYMTIRKFGA